ncbi:MAG: NAD(P)-dependent oxidoreductase [Bacteroidales bacterium]|nr:NAD(P)-dependent oxidoreductase [Bacteroidales bacterium]
MNKVLITGGSGFIGTNLIEFYSQTAEVLNIDINPPRNCQHQKYWVETDILDYNKLLSQVENFQPDYLLHMAARTDLDGKSLEDYSANIEGVKNVISVVNKVAGIKKVIFASSRLVCEIGYTPKDMDDYKPSTIYGESKVEGERIVKNSVIRPEWLIVRPTSIWGPWFEVPYRNFFDSVYKGTYFHPGKHEVRKSFGFVGNAVDVLDKLLYTDKLNYETMYLQDFKPLEVREWANLIRQQLGKSKVKCINVSLLKIVATIGDFLKILGINFPLTTFRLNNLMTTMVYDSSKVQNAVGKQLYTLEEGTQITTDWYLKNI